MSNDHSTPNKPRNAYIGAVVALAVAAVVVNYQHKSQKAPAKDVPTPRTAEDGLINWVKSRGGRVSRSRLVVYCTTSRHGRKYQSLCVCQQCFSCLAATPFTFSCLIFALF